MVIFISITVVICVYSTGLYRKLLLVAAAVKCCVRYWLNYGELFSRWGCGELQKSWPGPRWTKVGFMRIQCEYFYFYIVSVQHFAAIPNKPLFRGAHCVPCRNCTPVSFVRLFHQGRQLTVGSLSTCLQLPPALRPRHGPVRNSPLTLRLVLYIYRA